MGPCQRAPPSDSDVPRENMIKLYLSGPVFVNQSLRDSGDIFICLSGWNSPFGEALTDFSFSHRMGYAKDKPLILNPDQPCRVHPAGVKTT